MIKCLLLKLRQNLSRILLPSKAVHDLKFGKLDINGIVILAEKDLDVILEYIGTSLND